MKRKEAYILLITTFLLIFAWVIFTILHSAVSSTISENLNMQILPINPTFDGKTIENLKKRTEVIPENTIDETSQASTGATISPAPILSPSPTIPIPIGTTSATQQGG